MEFTREIQGGKTYLVYQIQPEDQIDTLGLGMIVNNKIEGIAPAIYNQMDNRKYLKYNISAKVPLKQFFMGTVNRQRLLSVMESILDGITAAEDYMLESAMLLLHPNYIFVDVSTGKAVLICVPTLERHKENIDPGTFFKAIMFNTQFDQSENGDHIAKIISYLNSTEQISITDFKQLIKGLMQETIKTSLPEPSQTQFLGKISVAPSYPGKEAPPVSGGAVKQGQPLNSVPQMQGAGKPAGGLSGAVAGQPPAGMQQGKPPISQPAGMGMPPKQPSVDHAAADAGFAIPGGGSAIPGNAGKKDKKKKEKKKTKEAVMKEKPPKEKKGFSLFGKKKKAADPVQQAGMGFAVPGNPQAVAPMGNPQAVVPPVNVQASVQQARQTANAAAVPPNGMPVHGNAPGEAATSGFGESQNRYAEVNIQMGRIGETTVLGNASMGQTVVLSGLNPDGKPNPRLTRVRNKEQVAIDKPVFRIGKERSYVDYFIGDNPAISRSHANIIIQQDGYYVEDMNSTNHTYVNDNIVVSGSQVKLEQGAKIRLGNEEFVFQY